LIEIRTKFQGQGSVAIGNQGTNNQFQWAVALGQNLGHIYQGFE
jgi:hypothetical protein